MGFSAASGPRPAIFPMTGVVAFGTADTGAPLKDRRGSRRSFNLNLQDHTRGHGRC